MPQVSELVRNTISTAGDATYAWSTGHYLKKRLEDAEIPVLGVGAYGAVVEDGGQVFKIFKTDEIGYGAFVKYLKGKSSVLLPQTEVIGTFGAYTCIHIERLEALTVLGENAAYQFSEWARYIGRRYREQKYGISHGCWPTKFPKEFNLFVNKANFIGMMKKMIDWSMANEYGDKVELDLHYGNFMVRTNADGLKQVVITDPWSEM